MKRNNRPFKFYPIVLAVVCALFLFSGCAASRNMLAAIFGDDSGNQGPGLTASDAQQLKAPDVGYRLARHFQKQGRHRLAVAELLKVVKAAPDHAGAYNALGVSYDRLREFDLAAAAYGEALRINPNLDYVYNNIGYSHLLQGNLEAAATAFETAVALKSERALYQNNLALAYARLGKNQNLSHADQVAAGVRRTYHPMPAYIIQETEASVNLHAHAARRDMKIKPVIIQTNRDIEILNGNGVRHMARRVQQYLNGQGIAVNRIANAPHFFHPRTVIYYSPGYYGQAREILDRFQTLNTTGKMIKSGAMNADIQIVLGRDLAAAVAGKPGSRI